jgi:hypothetical protein
MAIVTFSTLFAIMADPDNATLPGILAEKFPQDHILIRPGQWFVAGTGTAKELSDKLKITGDLSPSGPAVVMAVSGYYGRASSQIWEWVAAKVGKPSNG